MTTRDPRNPEQVKVNRGRRRKTYQTREENKRGDPKRERTTETTKSGLERRLEKFRERKSKTIEKEV